MTRVNGFHLPIMRIMPRQMQESYFLLGPRLTNYVAREIDSVSEQEANSRTLLLPFINGC